MFVGELNKSFAMLLAWTLLIANLGDERRKGRRGSVEAITEAAIVTADCHPDVPNGGSGPS